MWMTLNSKQSGTDLHIAPKRNESQPYGIICCLDLKTRLSFLSALTSHFPWHTRRISFTSVCNLVLPVYQFWNYPLANVPSSPSRMLMCMQMVSTRMYFYMSCESLKIWLMLDLMELTRLMWKQIGQYRTIKNLVLPPILIHPALSSSTEAEGVEAAGVCAERVVTLSQGWQKAGEDAAQTARAGRAEETAGQVRITDASGVCVCLHV